MGETKTADDVTKGEWIALAEAAGELLHCARFMFWLSGSGKADGPDRSVRDCLDKMGKNILASGTKYS